MLNRNKPLFKIALSICLLMILYGMVDKYVIPHPGLIQEKKKICNISTFCAGHTAQEHIGWDREMDSLRRLGIHIGPVEWDD